MVSADELHVPVYTPNCIVQDILDDCGVSEAMYNIVVG